ncbi:DUF4399 domain-containing protein [Beggiatoa alba]|nr:DUF4399 domain-containing protein [Beggiatoa alba]
MNKIIILFSLFFLAGNQAVLAASDGHEKHSDAMEKSVEVYIISPKNGATVASPVTVVFGLKGMGIAPAGVENEHTGHHHLLIDTGIPPSDKPIPSDANHHHFGKGQTETRLELTPGKHTLQLLIGNHSHMQHAKPIVSEKITITIE